MKEPSNPTPDYDRIAPAYQETVYIVMWQSNLSGGTYSALRKSVEGKDRLLRTLAFLGFNMSTVQVIEQEKPWVLVHKNERKL